jgi:hypothetical protein
MHCPDASNRELCATDRVVGARQISRVTRTLPSGQRVLVLRVLGSGLTQMFGLASGSPVCLEIDLSARSGCSRDAYRSGGVTY